MAGSADAPLPWTWRRFAIAMALGGLGGATFAYLKLPLPWMLGAMIATTIAALSGVQMAIPGRLRQVFITVLGVMLGSAFTPDIGRRLGEWSEGLIVLLIYMPLATALCYLYFRKIGGFDHTTAYFAGTPGGVNEMVLVGEAMGGDMRAIALVHSLRILLVVFTIPIYFRYFAPNFAAGTLSGFQPLGLDLDWTDALVLIGCAVLGWPFARLLRLPAAQLVGPMALSAAAHFAGLTASKPPYLLVAFAQVMMGSAIGSRFSGLQFRTVTRMMRLSLGATAIMLGLTALLTWASSYWTRLPPDAIALALSPGGLTEMTLVALALGIEVAFVAAMHVIRIALVVMFAPAFFKLVLRR